MSDKIELVKNAAGRMVPTMVNGQPQTPFQGVGKFRPTGRKAAPPVRTCADYPADGNKVVSYVWREGAELDAVDGGSRSPALRAETRDLLPDRATDCSSEVEAFKVALRAAGIRDGMRISSHHHFRNGDRIAVPLSAPRPSSA